MHSCPVETAANATRHVSVLGVYFWRCDLVCGAESLSLSVRLPVCPSMGPQQQTGCYRFAAVRPAGRKYRSIAAAAAGECGQCPFISVRR